jgi:hypothetical protein
MKISRGIYIAMFFLSTLACVGLLMVKPEWFWVMLPFITTGLAGSFNALT